MPDSKLPLGQDSAYPCTYSRDLLFPIARSDAREAIGISANLPFRGTDIWNAWELTWLGPADRPAVATAEIRVPADSTNLVESKSLKLYLNSFSMSRFENASSVADTIAADRDNVATIDACYAVCRTHVFVTPLKASDLGTEKAAILHKIQSIPAFYAAK